MDADGGCWLRVDSGDGTQERVMLRLAVTPEILAQMQGSQYGDIVTLGSTESPCIDQRTGFVVPPDMQFILVPTEDL